MWVKGKVMGYPLLLWKSACFYNPHVINKVCICTKENRTTLLMIVSERYVNNNFYILIFSYINNVLKIKWFQCWLNLQCASNQFFPSPISTVNGMLSG